MTRERSFFRRGKSVLLHELTGLVALRPADTGMDRAAGPLKAGSKAGVSMVQALAPEVALPQMRAFEDAGWVFVPKTMYDDADMDAVPAKVFVKSGGRLALTTNKLTVQLRGDPPDQQAATLLGDYGCRVVDKMTFAPGLFRVAITDTTRDALDVANALTASNLCEFAEPELIEHTGHR